MPEQTVEMRDAAYPGNLSGWGGAVGGYLHAPRALNPWTAGDWRAFTGNRKLPIWEAGYDGEGEAFSALHEMFHLGIRPGKWIALAMETRVDVSYVTRFGRVMRWAGFYVMVYGSTSTLFDNPELDGWWVADPTDRYHMYQRAGTVATQAVDAGTYDAGLIDASVAADLWR